MLLVDRNKAVEIIRHEADVCNSGFTRNILNYVRVLVEEIPTIDAVVLPCKIGDTAFAIRNYKGTPLPQQGFVSEMTFTNDMRLMIVVKHCARGIWGETVFPTYEAAMAAIAERRNHG